MVGRVVPVTLTLAVVTAGTACAHQGQAAPPTSARPAANLVLLDADSHGAVVVDGHDRVVYGIRRDGTRAWRLVLDEHAPLPVGCLATCPDAVFAGTVASINEASVPDPAPVFIVAGRRHVLSAAAGPGQEHKRRVLAAESLADLIMATVDGNGDAWLELRRGGTLTRIAVGGIRTAWAQTPDAVHGLAITVLAPGTAQARWLTLHPSGWRSSGEPVPVAGHGACLAPDGQRAILLGQAPAVAGPSGTSSAITDLETVGTCAFARTGAILAALTQRSTGPRSLVRVIDGSGAVTFATDLDADARVLADPTGSRVAYVAAGVLHELDPRTGAQVRTVRQARSARYGPTGELVVLRADLSVEWLG